jgi:hypothetical protein
MENKKGAKRERSPSAEGSPLPDDAKTITDAIRISASTEVPIRYLVAPPLLLSVRAGQRLEGDTSERPFFAYR